MSILSKQYFLAFLLFGLTAFFNFGQLDENVCKLNPNKIKMHLRGAFLFDDWLYLLTEKWNVYELPITYLKIDYGKLLVNETAIKVDQKWPALHIGNFSAYEPDITFIFSFNNNKKPSLLFLPKTGDGFLLNLKDRSVTRRYKATKYTDGSVMISNLANKFYSLALCDTQYCLQPWTVEYNQLGDVSHFGKTDRMMYLFHNEQKTQILASNENATAGLPANFVPFTGDQMMTGFVWDGNLTLFSSEHIYFFSVDSMQSERQPFPLTVVSANQYFECRLMSASSASSFPIGIVVGVVLLLATILAGCLLVRQQVVKRHHRNRNRHSHRKVGLKSDVTSRISTNRSALSEDMGKLSVAPPPNHAPIIGEKTLESAAMPSKAMTQRSTSLVLAGMVTKVNAQSASLNSAVSPKATVRSQNSRTVSKPDVSTTVGAAAGKKKNKKKNKKNK